MFLLCVDDDADAIAAFFLHVLLWLFFLGKFIKFSFIKDHKSNQSCFFDFSNFEFHCAAFGFGSVSVSVSLSSLSVSVSVF